MLSIIWTIIIGFVAGLIARAVKPGDDKLGFIMTAVFFHHLHDFPESRNDSYPEGEPECDPSERFKSRTAWRGFRVGKNGADANPATDADSR